MNQFFARFKRKNVFRINVIGEMFKSWIQQAVNRSCEMEKIPATPLMSYVLFSHDWSKIPLPMAFRTPILVFQTNLVRAITIPFFFVSHAEIKKLWLVLVRLAKCWTMDLWNAKKTQTKPKQKTPVISLISVPPFISQGGKKVESRFHNAWYRFKGIISFAFQAMWKRSAHSTNRSFGVFVWSALVGSF